MPKLIIKSDVVDFLENVKEGLENYNRASQTDIGDFLQPVDNGDKKDVLILVSNNFKLISEFKNGLVHLVEKKSRAIIKQETTPNQILLSIYNNQPEQN